ncbi:MAG: putative zinc ribbon domain protein [Acidobacteriota bacterium]|jgi:predicted  nucleic acid-binding Zn-ribbon protein|nr:putative zinc ribbon domain protein [Acidobacteriota bacterium]
MKMQLEELVKLQAVDARLDELGRTQKHAAPDSGGAPVAERERLLAERRTIAATVRPDLLRYYERVRGRHPQAIVGTSDGSCLGCFTRRPTSMDSRPGGFEICERCGRILIRPE